jgi:APA family basic amino acid/polyamine antiporter
VFEWTSGAGLHRTGAFLNLPAAAVVLLLAGVLCFGTKESSRVTVAVVIVKLVTILLIIACGAVRVDPAHWQPFIPPNTGQWGNFGASGILRGASVVFVAYLGFDVVAAVAKEVRDPQRIVPQAILAVVVVCTILYVLMALAITGLAPYSVLGVSNPVALATERAGLTSGTFRGLLAVGTIVGLTSGVLAILFAQTRVFFAMSRDRLLPDAVSRLSKRFGTPVVATVVTGVLAAALAGLLPLNVLSELIAIGTLTIFVLVCIGIIVTRYRAPALPRPFRVRWSPLVPVIGATGCLLMMASLPLETWLRFIAWVCIGLLLYGARFVWAEDSVTQPDTPQS